jgi:hypothetical protein
MLLSRIASGMKRREWTLQHGGVAFGEVAEIPAHRVLELERHELTKEFDVYNQTGEKLCYGGTPFLLLRKKEQEI